MTKNGINLKTLVAERYEIPTSVYDGRFTKTTQFLLPAVNLNIRKKVIWSYFVDAFLDDKEYDHDIQRAVFCLFKTHDPSSQEWKAVYEFLINKEEYVLDYNVGRDNEGNILVMVVYQIPEEAKEIYGLFKRGWYSKFPDWYKEKFIREIQDENGQMIESVLWGAMNKSPQLKAMVEETFGCTLDDDDELWEKPRPFREYYRYSEGKELHEKAKNYGSAGHSWST